eukprot:scaffold323710_cov27-Tisochrysis_lutea.AAC.1
MALEALQLKATLCWRKASGCMCRGCACVCVCSCACARMLGGSLSTQQQSNKNSIAGEDPELLNCAVAWGLPAIAEQLLQGLMHAPCNLHFRTLAA